MAAAVIHDEPEETRPLGAVLACVWLLTLVGFSVPGRQLQAIGGLDGIALAKVATRGVCLVILGFLIMRYWRDAKRRMAMRCLFPLGLFVAWALLSTLWSPLKSISLGQSSSLLLLLMLAIALGSLCNTSRDLSKVLCHLSGALFVVGIVLLLCRFLLPGVHSMTRDGSGFFHSTGAGTNASLGLILLLAARLIWNWKWTRTLLLPGFAVHSAVMLLAMNRVSALLTVLLCVMVFFLFADRGLASAAMLATGILVTAYVALDPGLEMSEGIFGGATEYIHYGQSAKEIKSLSGRDEMWRAIWKSHLESPLRGHGYFVTSKTGKLYVWYSRENWTAHNMVLQALATTGWIGCALLTWGLIAPCFRVLAAWWRGEIAGNVMILFVLIGVWFLAWGILNTSILGPLSPLSVVFFTVLGLAVGALPCADAASAREPAGWSLSLRENVGLSG